MNFGSFDEAVRAAKARGVVLPLSYYQKLKGAARARAFTVSNITSIRQIRRILESLISALVNGKSFSEWKKIAAENVEQLSNARKEVVYRNAMQTAYNVGRWSQMQETKALRPILMYDAINDSRTRPNHAAMDGFMAHMDSPIWNTWLPPNGHNCRCTILSLTLRQARDRGYRENAMPPAGVTPDEGWGYNGAKAFGDVLEKKLKSEIDHLPQRIKETVKGKVKAKGGANV